MTVTQEMYERAKELDQETSKISRGKKTKTFSHNSGIVGKVGEFAVRSFFEDYVDGPWISYAESINPCGGDWCDLLLYNLKIEVKTRQLHTDATIAPIFDLRVPSTEVDKKKDIYILAGYCPSTSMAYVFGWCTWEELQAKPVRSEGLLHPAKCVELQELHPMLELEAYARKRASYLGVWPEVEVPAGHTP